MNKCYEIFDDIIFLKNRLKELDKDFERFSIDIEDYLDIYKKNKNFENNYYGYLYSYLKSMELLAKEHADEIILKLYEDKEDDKDELINKLVKEIEIYFENIDNIDNKKTKQQLEDYLEILIEFRREEIASNLIENYIDGINKENLKDSNYIKLDFENLYNVTADRLLLTKEDANLAMKFYKFASLDWNKNNHIEYIIENNKAIKFSNQKVSKLLRYFSKINEWHKSKRSCEEMISILEGYFQILEEVKDEEKLSIADVRCMILSLIKIQNNYLPYILYQLNNEDILIKNKYKEKIIEYINQNKRGKMKEVVDFLQNQEIDENRKFIYILLFADVICRVREIKNNLLVTDATNIAYYTSIDIFRYMLPINKTIEEKNNIGKLAVMNVSYMNDPSEGKTLKNFLYGKDKYKFDNEREKVNVPYVFLKCFTTQIDYLPMWEMYGNHSKGCCIKIDWKKTIEHSDKKNMPLYNVLYISENKEKYRLNKENNKNIKNFDYVVEQLKKIKNNIKEILHDQNAMELFEMLITDITYLFKDASYSYEQEMRIIYSFDNVEDSLFKKTIGEYPNLYVYTEFPIQINELILGPKFNNIPQKIPFIQEQIELMCKNTATDMPIITKSSIKYI